MAKQLSNYDEALTARCSHAGERVPQVMQPHVIELCCGSNSTPWLFDVH
jgi:hypothetical protein